ncbi:PqiC family protein [Rugamonas apoptosis]|uniref:Membrane integrity-associated transporter subunit PqiC n=1 Tax=Rugamonas apoptosis TaxID=2758570 RepID=A0A7W2IMU6_9BURK|nr:PqiC family protein [Rugamonas apoptosis]MBA5689926.1 membrane integrity-associated transporter subunit PqiC [Rugamonas apoptosis]
MKRMLRLFRLAAVAGLAACSSTPLHYHTLLAPAGQGAAAAQPAPFLIEVLPVGIPVQLDQPQLVVRQGDSSIALLEGERWAGPLDDEVRAALSANLTQRLATQDIAGLARPGDKPVMRIKLQVRRFDIWPGQRAQLDADWSLGLADEAGHARLTCRGRFDMATPGGYPAQVQGQQRLIAALADRIAADARAWSRSRQAGCSIMPSTAGAISGG